VSADFVVPADVGLAGCAKVSDGVPAAGARGDVAGARGDVIDDGLDSLLRSGPSVAARSAGAGPIVVAAAGERRSVPVGPVPVVDTLGAGDVLHGALAAWLAVRGGAAAQEQAAEAKGAATTGAATTGASLAQAVRALAWAGDVASASCAAAGARGWTADGTLLRRLREELGTGTAPQ
jgi:sugar/nucleoside kinase (ribokinase family)